MAEVGLGELDLHSQPAGQHSRPSGTIVSEIGNAAGSEPHSSGCIKSGNINMSREHADLVAGAVAGAANVLSVLPVLQALAPSTSSDSGQRGGSSDCRMQSAEYRQLGGPGAVLRDLLAAEGLRGLGRGLGATVMREVPGNALFF
ncbi:aquaporin NIP1-2, partial [Haematococcus lacustris]